MATQTQQPKTCKCGGTLKFLGHYAAPGSGQAWKCERCGNPYKKMGTTWIDEWQTPEEAEAEYPTCPDC